MNNRNPNQPPYLRRQIGAILAAGGVMAAIISGAVALDKAIGANDAGIQATLFQSGETDGDIVPVSSLPHSEQARLERINSTATSEGNSAADYGYGALVALAIAVGGTFQLDSLELRAPREGQAPSQAPVANL